MADSQLPNWEGSFGEDLERPKMLRKSSPSEKKEKEEKKRENLCLHEPGRPNRTIQQLWNLSTKRQEFWEGKLSHHIKGILLAPVSLAHMTCGG